MSKRKKQRTPRFDHEKFNAVDGGEIHTVAEVDAYVVPADGFLKLVKYGSWIHKDFQI